MRKGAKGKAGPSCVECGTLMRSHREAGRQHLVLDLIGDLLCP